MWIASWRQAYIHAFPPEVLNSLSVEVRTQQTLTALARDDMRVFVGEPDGQIGGFASVGPSEAFEGCGELFALYVDAAYWGSGLGQALLDRAEDDLLLRGFRSAVLFVLVDNPRAHRFYERNGWVAGERFHEAFFGHRVEVVRYRKELDAGKDARQE